MSTVIIDKKIALLKQYYEKQQAINTINYQLSLPVASRPQNIGVQQLSEKGVLEEESANLLKQLMVGMNSAEEERFKSWIHIYRYDEGAEAYCKNIKSRIQDQLDAKTGYLWLWGGVSIGVFAPSLRALIIHTLTTPQYGYIPGALILKGFALTLSTLISGISILLFIAVMLKTYLSESKFTIASFGTRGLSMLSLVGTLLTSPVVGAIAVSQPVGIGIIIVMGICLFLGYMMGAISQNRHEETLDESLAKTFAEVDINLEPALRPTLDGGQPQNNTYPKISQVGSTFGMWANSQVAPSTLAVPLMSPQ